MAQTKAPARGKAAAQRDPGAPFEHALPGTPEISGGADVEHLDLEDDGGPELEVIEPVSEDDLLDAAPAPDLRHPSEVIAELQERHSLSPATAAIAYHLNSRHRFGCPATRLEAHDTITTPRGDPPVKEPVTVVRCVDCGEQTMARRTPAKTRSR